MDDLSKKQEIIEQLVIEAQAGSSDAFAKLYDGLIDQIYRYVYYRVGSGEAEDITELVFLKTWENIHQYKSGKATFSAWVFRIAHNLVVDYYREKKSNQFLELDTNYVDTTMSGRTDLRAHRSLNKDILYDAMQELNENYRQILILKYINSLSNEEIATVIDKSQAALRILQFRALKSLKKILESRGISNL